MALEQNTLARLLQERRESAGYSRARLGKIVGVSAGTIEGWELGRVGRPPFHEVMRIASFLRIPLEDIERAVFADAGSVPDRDEHPGQPERKKAGRKKRPGAVPLLEAAFRLYGWGDEADAGEALGHNPRSGSRLAKRTRAHGRRGLHGAHNHRQRRAGGRDESRQGGRQRHRCGCRCTRRQVPSDRLLSPLTPHAT